MSSSNESTDVMDRLFDDFVENSLAPADQAELSTWLQAADKNVDRFARECFLHWQLFSILGRKHLHAEVMAGPPRQDVGKNGTPFVDANTSLGTTRVKQRGPSVRSLGFLAAGLIVAGAITLGFVLLRTTAVAQLSQVTAGAVFNDAESPRTAGALLNRGQRLKLREGRVLATLVSGARVVLEGPAELQFVGNNEVRLEKGRLGADVPTQATGFSVQTPLGDFIDLGTEYTLDLLNDDVCTVYVFTGMVELRPAHGDHRPVNITEGNAVRYDAADGEAVLLPYDEGQRLAVGFGEAE